MNRRKLLLMTSLAPLTVAASAQTANSSATPGAANQPPPFDLVLKPASACITAGEECLSFCIYKMGQGAKEFEGCARAVNELVPLCRAAQSLALLHGRQLQGLLQPTLAAARVCETACRAHAQETQCKACADACAALIRGGEQFLVEMRGR